MSAVLADLEIQEIFLDVLRMTNNISLASKTINLAAANVRNFRKKNDEFRAKFEDAQEEYLDMLEMTLAERAVKGTVEPVFFQGEQCGTVRKFSDSNGQFILKGRRSKTFRERTDLTVKGLEGLGDRMAAADKRTGGEK